MWSTLRSRLWNRRREEASRVAREQEHARAERSPSTGELVERAELQRRIAAALIRLEEPLRTTALLRYLEGLAPADIARRTGVPTGTVRKRLQRGAERLRRGLTGEDRRALRAIALAPFAEALAGGGLPSGSPMLAALGGALAMKKVLVGLSVVTLFVLGVGWWIGSQPSGGRGARRAAERSSAALADTSGDVAAAATAGQPGHAPSTRVEAMAAEPLATRAPCTVFGRVVDEGARPLEGVRVRLRGYGGWAAGHDVPRLESPSEGYGWEAITDEVGAFRFHTPVPTIEIAWLTITPGPLRADARIYFGGGGSGARPPLGSGEHDLGTFRLAAAGAIRGTVRAREGAPIAGARLDVVGPDKTSYGTGTETDATVVYLVPHVPAGRYGLEARAKGYLAGFEMPIVVEPAQATAGPDFVLSPAPTLRGRVTDAAGRAIAGARVWASAAAPGVSRPADAESAPDGSFVLFLPQDGTHTIGVAADGYVPVGVGARAKVYEPGTKGIRIVLKADVTTSFRVVDADDGTPVEHFGLRIDRNHRRKAPGPEKHWLTGPPPPPRERPGGEVVLGARPGIDRFKLFAPGYLELEGEVEHDDGAPGRQTLRLSRGDSLTGLVLAGGVPVEDLAVTLTPGRFQAEVSDAGEGLRTFFLDAEKRLMASTDARGRFTFHGVERGRKFELSATRSGKGVLRLVPVSVLEHGVTDLGELELAAPSRIVAQLLLPPEVHPAGLKVNLGDRRQDVAATSDVQGRLQLDGLGPGSYTLDVEGVPGVLSDGNPFAAELAAGETLEMELDCRGRSVAEVALRIELGGAPVTGAQIELRGVEDPSRRLYLGELGADGRVLGWVPAGGEAFADVQIQGYTTLRHPAAHRA